MGTTVRAIVGVIGGADGGAIVGANGDDGVDDDVVSATSMILFRM